MSHAASERCTIEWCERKRRSSKADLCHTHYERRRQGKDPRFPVAPLVEYARQKGITLPEMPETYVEVSLERADALCIDVLNVHPYQVYGDYYFNAA